MDDAKDSTTPSISDANLANFPPETPPTVPPTPFDMIEERDIIDDDEKDDDDDDDEGGWRDDDLDDDEVDDDDIDDDDGDITALARSSNIDDTSDNSIALASPAFDRYPNASVAHFRPMP